MPAADTRALSPPAQRPLTLPFRAAPRIGHLRRAGVAGQRSRWPQPQVSKVRRPGRRGARRAGEGRAGRGHAVGDRAEGSVGVAAPLYTYTIREG